VFGEEAAPLTVFQRTAQFTIPARNKSLDQQFVELWRREYPSGGSAGGRVSTSSGRFREVVAGVRLEPTEARATVLQPAHSARVTPADQRLCFSRRDCGQPPSAMYPWVLDLEAVQEQRGARNATGGAGYPDSPPRLLGH
jgi:hypothetical protein